MALREVWNEIEGKGAMGASRLLVKAGLGLLRWAEEHDGFRTDQERAIEEEMIGAGERYLAETGEWPLSALFRSSPAGD